MGKIINHGNWKKEKGITLIETVVSLTIVIIISLACFSLVIFAANSRKKASVNRFFSNLTHQCLKLYTTYTDGSEFEDGFSILTNQTIEYGVDTTFYLNETYHYVTSESYKYSIIFDFEDDSLKITSLYSNGDKILVRSAAK